MSGYRADPDRILDLVEHAVRLNRRIEARIAEVEQAVAQLHTGWDGDAERAHRQAHETWQREMRDMNTALNVLQTRARAARQRYLDNVDHHRRIWP